MVQRRVSHRLCVKDDVDYDYQLMTISQNQTSKADNATTQFPALVHIDKSSFSTKLLTSVLKLKPWQLSLTLPLSSSLKQEGRTVRS